MALPFMWAVRNRCPDVHLTLVEGLSPSLLERVLSGNLDLAVAYNPPRNGRLTVWPLLIEDLFLVGRPEIIGGSDAPIAFADIPQKEVLGLYPIPASRAIIQAQILRNQITPSPTLEIDSLNSMRLALESGLGCAILAKASVGAELVSGRIHARRIVEPEIERTLSLIALADRPQTRAFDEVRRAVIETASREVAEGRWIARPGDGIPIKSI
jgi:LysR family nitrogen assimilation transcriptional regulator